MHELDYGEFKRLLEAEKARQHWDYAVCSGNTLLGSSPDAGKSLEMLFESGIDAVVTGEKCLARPSARKLVQEGHHPVVRPLNVPRGVPGHGALQLKCGEAEWWLVSLDSGSDRRPLEDVFGTFEEWLKKRSPRAPVIAAIHGHDLAVKKMLAWRSRNQNDVIHCLGTGLGLGGGAIERPSGGNVFVPDLGAIEAEGTVQGVTPEHWWQLHRERKQVVSALPAGCLRGDGLLMRLNDRFEAVAVERLVIRSRAA